MNLTKVTERQYNRILNKLGKDVYIDGEPYKVLFESSKSKNASESLFIGYPQSYGWNKGTIFSFHGNYYLLINRDCVESDVYYTSVAKKCNVNWHIGGQEYHLVAGDLSSANPKMGTKFSEIQGNVMMYTNMGYMINVNNIVWEFSGTYICVNKFDVDGLSYYFFQKTDNPNYSSWRLSILNEFNQMTVGDVEKLICELRFQTTGTSNLYRAPAAEFTFISSDETVVRVENGKLVAVGTGTATITIKTNLSYPGNSFTNIFTNREYTNTINMEVVAQ